MSAVAAIVLADALGTPVNHTFTPLGPDANGVWWFEDQSQSTPIGYWRISLQLTRVKPGGTGQASSKDRVNRVKIGIHIPTLETLGTSDNGITPPPTVSFIDRANIELILPERDNLQVRKDLRKFCQNLMAETQVTAMVESLQGVY